MRFYCTFLFFLLLQTVFSQSVLESGAWAKVKIQENGVYKISYEDIIDMGFSNPVSVQVFGNGNEELSLLNSTEDPELLREIGIFRNFGADGVFNSGDYILFYGAIPSIAKYSSLSKKYEYAFNKHEIANFYYITINRPSTKVIGTFPAPLNPVVSKTITNYDYVTLYEKNETNVIKSGQVWLESIGAKSVSFSMENINVSDSMYVSVQLAGRNNGAGSFSVAINDIAQTPIVFNQLNLESEHAILVKNTYKVFPASNAVSVKITPTFSGISSKSYLDYCLLQARKKLTLSSGQLIFSDLKSLSASDFGEFVLTCPSNTIIWNVSDEENPQVVVSSYSNGTLKFVTDLFTLRKYVAFTNFKQVQFVKNISNTDILSHTDKQMIIVVEKQLLPYAQKIADYHIIKQNMTVGLVCQEDIFNEFSSGRTDIAAIRNYFRYLYKKGNTLQYVLLFGDGSYDNRVYDSEKNQILTYQSKESMSIYNSLVSDDFFALLDENEGVNANDDFTGNIDIAIGRYTINTKDEANNIVNKFISYTSDTKHRGSWQNNICFLADDADGDQLFHMEQADLLASQIFDSSANFNIKKFYLDAYKQEVNSAGQSYPTATVALMEQVKQGCLLLNYTGHGSEMRMTQEQVVNQSLLSTWNNTKALPLVITASCEVARFDNSEIQSLGEQFLVQQNGGAIALLSTTRVVYSTSNYFLNSKIFSYLFENNANGKPLTIGQAFVLAKNNMGFDINQNKHNFMLLGNPALMLNIPTYSISVDSINHIAFSDFTDTLRANSIVTISGSVANCFGEKQTNYNGMATITLFDKEQKVVTLGNDVPDKFEFMSQKNTLFKGQAYVVNGLYSTEITIPSDILFYNGKGKISLFANNNEVQASGSVFVPVIGTSEQSLTDNTPPTIRLYMNDTLFESNRIVHENPILYAHVFDESGITISQSAIGHELLLIINDDEKNAIVLNDYYLADPNTYKSGTISYPLSQLQEGENVLRLRVWDSYNNMSESTIIVVVVPQEQVVLQNMYAYPNPTNTGAHIVFEHNQADEIIEVICKIYNVMGESVRELYLETFEQGFVNNKVFWDGKSKGGMPVPTGVYSYTIEIKTVNGTKLLGRQKIIVLK